jgi:FkbM family methyltransferase
MPPMSHLRARLGQLRSDLDRHYRLFGHRGVLVPLRAHAPMKFQVTPDQAAHPITLRAGSSDVLTYEQVFVKHQYAINLGEPPGTIVDCGAYVGLTAAYFATTYPEARIIAVEPDPGNFDLLRENVGPYPRVVPVHGAVWSEETVLRVIDPGFGSWGYRTVPGRSCGSPARGEVTAQTIPQLIEEHEFDQIDILKLDIEGAETQVLPASGDWIDRVGVLAVELHPDLDPEVMTVFDRVAAGFDSRWRQGDVEIAARSTHLAAS